MILSIAGAAMGVAAGLLYTHFSGCPTGTCLYANPWVTAFSGALLGYLLVKVFTGRE
jgi:hypothetical protein